MKIKNGIVLKDALHNLASNSGATTDYCTGLTVGIVSALMAVGFTFQDALLQVARYYPTKNSPRLAVPDSWKQDLLEKITFLK